MIKGALNVRFRSTARHCRCQEIFGRSLNFYGQILQHMGVAYLRMGYADEAMECLEAAYAELKREEILEQNVLSGASDRKAICKGT